MNSVRTENGSHASKHIKHTFYVTCSTRIGERVYVTGDCDQLGAWNHTKCFPLEKCPRENNDWSGEIFVPSGTTVKYRYLVGIDVRHENSEKIIVRRWETELNPRFFIAGKDEAKKDTFGFISSSENIQNGWLTCDTAIQLKIFGKPADFWKKKHKNRSVYMKMMVMSIEDHAFSELMSESSLDLQDSLSSPEFPQTGWPIIQCASYMNENCSFQDQEQFGMKCESEECIIFEAHVLDSSKAAFMIDIFLEKENDKVVPEHVGYCHILPNCLSSDVGSATLPITSVTKPESLGKIHVEYIKIHPLKHFTGNLDVTYSKHWKTNWKGLDVGHRGSGKSDYDFIMKASILENTIRSLQKATEHGADFVEFDVQLSKDGVPILFHDHFVNLVLHKKNQVSDELTTMKVPIKDLTLKQLNELKLCHGGNKTHADLDKSDTEGSFPTLKAVLSALPLHVGFNIELKWTMELEDGTKELDKPYDFNEFVDIILEEVLENAGNRKIIFSCFNPDVCTAIRKKQNKYPVLFLTQGVTTKYAPYKDPRCSTIKMAVHHAINSDILGINVHTEDVMRDSSQLEYVVKHHLVCFCWGDDNNSKSNISYLKGLGMDAIIYDRIDDHINKQNVFFLEQ